MMEMGWRDLSGCALDDSTYLGRIHAILEMVTKGKVRIMSWMKYTQSAVRFESR